MQTKGGTSKFHGEVFEFLENNDLNAMTAGVKFEDFLNNQTPSIPILHRNQFGGNLGGPIYIPKLLPSLRDKLFFFASFEKFIEHDGNSLLETSVPSAAGAGHLLACRVGFGQVHRAGLAVRRHDNATSGSNFAAFLVSYNQRMVDNRL